jgi:hypothetical protein
LSEHDEGWPCYLSDEVAALLTDPKTDPQQRRVALGACGELGVAE